MTKIIVIMMFSIIFEPLFKVRYKSVRERIDFHQGVGGGTGGGSEGSQAGHMMRRLVTELFQGTHTQTGNHRPGLCLP